MDKITIERIGLLHPKIRKEVLELYKKANNVLGKGVRLRFTHTLRTPEEQRKLFLQKPKVTNADAWESYHNYGLAFDIALLYDKNGDDVFEEVSWDMVRDGDSDKISDWLEVTRVLLGGGYTNGFIKNGKRWDFPHFQKVFGLDWKEMKIRIESGKYIEENGNKYITI